MASQLLSEIKGEMSTDEASLMCVEWKVPDDLLFLQRTEHRIHSPSFYFEDATWFLTLRIHAAEPRLWGGPKDTVDFFLVLKDAATSRFCVNYHIGVKTVSGNTYRSHRDESISSFTKGLTCWGTLNVLCRLDLLQQRISLAPNGVVTFFCHFWVETERNLHAVPVTKLQEVQISKMAMKDEREDSGEISTEEASFMYVEWKVPDILSLSLDTTHKIHSPSFQLKDATWYLQITVNHKNFSRWDEIYGPIDLHLMRKDCATPTLHVDYKIGIKTVNGITYGTQGGEGVLDGNTECYMWANLLNRMDLCQFQHNLVLNRVMTFFCYLRLESASRLDAGSKTKMCEVTPKLLDDLKNLFLSGEDSDLTIKVKDKEFRVHKSILRARTSVFHSMFNHDMVEKKSGAIDIIDCEPEAFKIFLLYLYNGRVENLSMDTAVDLYRMADKYDAEDLKLECREFIVSNITVDTVCDVIEYALQYDETELLEATTEFFANNFKSIILTVKWQSFLRKNPATANELFIKASDNCIIRK